MLPKCAMAAAAMASTPASVLTSAATGIAAPPATAMSSATTFAASSERATTMDAAAGFGEAFGDAPPDAFASAGNDDAAAGQ